MKSFLPLAVLPFVLGCAAGVDLSNSGGGGAGGGSEGKGGGNPAGTGGGGGAGAGVPNAPLAVGLTISEVAIFQGVKIDVMNGGAPTLPNAVVAGRRGLVRVYVTPGAGYVAKGIQGVLTLTTAGMNHTFTSSITPVGVSSDAAWASTFNFDVDAASIGPDTTFVVRLQDPQGSGAGDASAQYPTTGTATTLGAQTTDALKISLFPIQFTQGGGTPATDPADIAAYQAMVASMYPTATVTITVEAPLSYGGAIPQANGNGWDQLLNAMIQKRSGDPATDVYYYGAFAPSNSFESFCDQGCVAGLSSIPNSPNDQGQKASIGLVYGGNMFDQQATGQTMAHEVGHGHGRAHSPTSDSVQGCTQPAAIDPSYPYPNGDIGVWGYDAPSQHQFAPTSSYDLMGYCQQVWISDYTYKGLFSWMRGDIGADIIQSSKPTTYRQIVIGGDGKLTIGASFPVYGLLSGAEHTVTFVDHGITETAVGHYYPYDHVPGGYVLVPEPAHFTSVKIADLEKVGVVRP